MRHGVRVPPQHLSGGRDCKKYTTIMAAAAVVGIAAAAAVDQTAVVRMKGSVGGEELGTVKAVPWLSRPRSEEEHCFA